MKIFNLPDLGEGLPDAIVREWYVKVGDNVNADQPLASMETAKALVDVPSPFTGKIAKLYGKPGDTIETGEPLIAFEGEAPADTPSPTATTTKTVKAAPAVRMLAKKLGVDINTITPTGNSLTVDDVKRAAESGPELEGAWVPLSNVQRAMASSMAKSHSEIVPVSLMDDADLHAWPKGQDIMVRLIRAIQAGCQAEPMLNAAFNGKQMAYQDNKAISIGMAVDTPNGLYVPVLKDVTNRSDAELREQINRFKQQAQDHSIPQEDLHGATIMLSNFGALAGRYANPVLVQPMVAIIGVGRSRDEIVPENGQPAVHRIMPLSITIDHRAVTGGQSARFLKVMIDNLRAVS